MKSMSFTMACALAAGSLAAGSIAPAHAGKHDLTDAGAGQGDPVRMMEHSTQSGLLMPSMNAARGRELFVAKKCIVCHSVNNVGGVDAPPLDAETMPGPMNPFEFAARMWRGAEAMIYLQQEELGGQIELTGQELADIIAFAHDPEEQASLSEADIPPDTMRLVPHGDDNGDLGEEHHGE